MKDCRKKLPIGETFEGGAEIVGYLDAEDTDSFVVYKLCKKDIEHDAYVVDDVFGSPVETKQGTQCFILLEYYPAEGCARDDDGTVSYDKKILSKEKFDKGRALFFRLYLDMCKPEGEQQFGKPLDYQMFNGTAYCVCDFDRYEYIGESKSILNGNTLPDELCIPYKKLSDVSYQIKNNELIISGVDFSQAPYNYLVEKSVDYFNNNLKNAIVNEREMLEDMVDRLSLFENNNEDNQMGDSYTTIDKEKMDTELGSGDSEWRILRNLTRDGDEFRRWSIPGNCWGVSMVRNGRVFKHWITAIT